MPNGFSMITRTSAPSWRSRPCAPSASTITGKKLGGGREVEGAVERFARALVEAVEHRCELAVDALVVERAGHVLDVREQPREHVLVGGRREKLRIACSHSAR